MQQYQQLSINLPLESWKYHVLKSRAIDQTNIEYRFHAHEAVSHGRGNGIFSVEEENNEGCGEGCECEKHRFGGFDVDSYEPVNLLKHIESGKTGFDDQWNVVTEHTIDALYKGGKKGGKKGSKQG